MHLHIRLFFLIYVTEHTFLFGKFAVFAKVRTFAMCFS